MILSLVVSEHGQLMVEFKMLKLPLLSNCEDNMMVSVCFRMLIVRNYTHSRSARRSRINSVLAPIVIHFHPNIVIPLCMHLVTAAVTRYTSSEMKVQ